MRSNAPELQLLTPPKTAPHAMIVGKRHVQDCLASMLEPFGFVTCAYNAQLDESLCEFQPDLFLMWVCHESESECVSIVKRLAREGYKGKVLLVGGEKCPSMIGVRELGVALGFATMAPLYTPICDKTLWSAVRDICPVNLALPNIDLLAAAKSHWLELWYQPKFDIRTFRIVGAEALVRMRHPKWGLIQPSQFVPNASEKALIALSDYVIAAAMSDWHHFAVDYGDLELAINIPLNVLTRSGCMKTLINELPQDHRFHRALIETDAAEVIDRPGSTKCVASELTHHHLALSLDDVGADWVGLCAIEDAPIAEIKVDRSLLHGCAKSFAKQSVCRRIIEFARRIELRTVAEGVETRADLLAAREIGFDLVQGFICGRPMVRNRLSSVLREQWGTAPQYPNAA